MTGAEVNEGPVRQDRKIKGGRPDLALSTIPKVGAVDQMRNELDAPDVRGRDEVNTQEEAMLRTDYAGTYDTILELARNRSQNPAPLLENENFSYIIRQQPKAELSLRA